MGWCHEFGSQITDGCDYPMRAEPDRCTCSACGVDCHGRFAGCSWVWERGPREGASGRPQTAAPPSGQAVSLAGGGATTAVPAAMFPEDGRLEVLAWLELAFKEVRAGLEFLEAEGRNQRRAIKALADDTSFERLASLAETLPERIAAASAGALIGQLSAGAVGDIGPGSEELRRATAAMQESVVQLRREIAELRSGARAAPDASDAPRPQASGTAEGPAGPLADKPSAPSARNEWKAVRDRISGRREDGPGH